MNVPHFKIEERLDSRGGVSCLFESSTSPPCRCWRRASTSWWADHGALRLDPSSWTAAACSSCSSGRSTPARRRDLRIDGETSAAVKRVFEFSGVARFLDGDGDGDGGG
jgi:hypothetical protein